MLTCHLCLYDLETKNDFHIFKYKSKIEKKKKGENSCAVFALGTDGLDGVFSLGPLVETVSHPCFLRFNQEIDDTKLAILAAT